MAYHFSVNKGYTATEMGPYPLFDLKTLMKAHGWTVTRSNNGTTASAGDNILTATDLTSQYSWMVLQSSSGATGREWLFGRHNNVDCNEWYVGYSANVGGVGGFTGGDATTMPSATDETAVLQDRSGAPYDLFPAFFKSYYCHMMVDDATDAFYLITVAPNNRLILSCLAGDPLSETHASDADPYVAMAQYYNYYTSITGTSSPWGYWESYVHTRGWYNYPSGSAEKVSASFFMVGVSREFCPNDGTYGGGISLYDGKDEAFPVIWGRPANKPAPYGYKGVSTLFHNISTVRAPCDILTVGTEKWILTGTTYGYNVSLPWDPTLLPL